MGEDEGREAETRDSDFPHNPTTARDCRLSHPQHPHGLQELQAGMAGEEALRTELDKARFEASVANERSKSLHEKIDRCANGRQACKVVRSAETMLSITSPQWGRSVKAGRQVERHFAGIHSHAVPCFWLCYCGLESLTFAPMAICQLQEARGQPGVKQLSAHG